MIFIILIIFSYSCSPQNKSQINNNQIFYYEKLTENINDMDTSKMDSSFSYSAMILKDTLDNLKKIILYSYNQNENTIRKNDVYIIRKESWGLSRIIYSKTNSPFLRIDTKENVIWEYPEETAKYIFSTQFKFIRKDNLYIKSLAKAITVYVFEFGYAYENLKFTIYLDENFRLIAKEPLDSSYMFFKKIRAINPEEAPLNFRELLNGVLI